MPAGRVRRARPAAACWPTCAAGASAWSASTRQKASPFAQSLLFNWIAAYMYEGDAPAGRAAGGRAGARPRPAARAARRRGAARADRSRGARRPRARAAVPRRAAAGPARPTSCTTCCAGWATSALAELDLRATERPSAGRGVAADARGRAAGHRRAGRPARSASPPPRTPPATATRSACALPLGLPARLHRPGRAPARAARRPATPAPTGRSSPTRLARRLGTAVERVHRRPAGPGDRGPAGAGRVPARRRRARVVRRRGAAPAAAALARRAAQGGRAGRARPRCARFLPAWQGIGVAGRRGLDGARRGRRRAAGRAPSRRRTLDARRARARGSGGYRPADLDELCTSGEVVWVGAGGARRAATAGCGCTSATRSRLLADRARRRRRARRPPCTTRSAPTWPARGACFWSRAARRRRRRHRRPSCWPPCGTWCGRARSPTTRWRRCGPTVGGAAAPAASGRRGHGRGGRGPGRGPDGSLGIGPPAGAGRWSLVAPLLEPAAVADRGGARPGLAAARAPRRADPRGGAGRGVRGWVRRRCTAC